MTGGHREEGEEDLRFRLNKLEQRISVLTLMVTLLK
jgi:hypothetical protein